MKGRLSVPERVKRKHGRPFEEVLREYAGRPLTPEQVAGELGCCLKSLIEHGKDLDIEIVRRIHVKDR